MSTPTCPSCGAKFSHDPKKLECKHCGLPDEIAAMGRDMILRWQKFVLRQMGKSKRTMKRTIRPVAGSRFKKRKKHGRT